MIRVSKRRKDDFAIGGRIVGGATCVQYFERDGNKTAQSAVGLLHKTAILESKVNSAI